MTREVKNWWEETAEYFQAEMGQSPYSRSWNLLRS